MSKVKFSWYEVLYILILISFLAAGAMMWRKAKQPTVGILEVDKVATELGYTDKLTTDFQLWQDEAIAQVKILEAEAKVDLKALEDKTEAAATPEEKELLEIETAQRHAQYNKDRNNIRWQQVGRQVEAKKEFRAKIQPAIDEVAREMRLNIVLTPPAAYINERAVITADVIAKAKELGLEAAASEE